MRISIKDRLLNWIDDARIAIGTRIVKIGAQLCGRTLYQHSFYCGGKHPSDWTHEWTLTRRDIPKKKKIVAMDKPCHGRDEDSRHE